MAGHHLVRRAWRADRHSVRVLAAALAVGLGCGVVVVGVSHDSEAPVAAGVPAAPTIQTAATSSGTGSAVAAPDPGPVTLAFVGDVNAELSLAERLQADPDGFVGPFADTVRGADLAVANLEAALTDRGAPVAKDFTFRAPPGILEALRAGGIDVVSVANNHGIDYGPDGLARTLEIAGARDDHMVIGIGHDEDEAYAPHVAEVGGQRIAVIAATQVLDSNLIESWTATPDRPGLASAKRVDRLVREVHVARAAADTVVVFLHWGTETETCPNPEQQQLARVLADAGADLIIGSHAHRVLGAGRLGGAFVAYGLGNFLFGAASPDSAKTGVLLVTVDGRDIIGYEWRPGRIVDRVPQVLPEEEAAAASAEWNDLRACTGLAE